MREMLLELAEILFHLTNGIPLIETNWFALWILFWAVVMFLPIFHFLHLNPKRWSLSIAFYMIITICWVVFSFITAVSPGVIQSKMMEECETVVSIVETDRINPTSIFVEQCRTKENYFGEFGEWKIKN